MNSHLTYLYQKNQQVKPVGAHIIWGYKCFANRPGADLLLFDCIKYRKYYLAIFCILEVAFKIHLAQKKLTFNGHDASGYSYYKTREKGCMTMIVCESQWWYCIPVAQWLEHCVSSAKAVGSIPREHTYWQYKCISRCKSLWIKASDKCKCDAFLLISVTGAQLSLTVCLPWTKLAFQHK